MFLPWSAELSCVRVWPSSLFRVLQRSPESQPTAERTFSRSKFQVQLLHLHESGESRHVASWVTFTSSRRPHDHLAHFLDFRFLQVSEFYSYALKSWDGPIQVMLDTLMLHHNPSEDARTLRHFSTDNGEW